MSIKYKGLTYSGEENFTQVEIPNFSEYNGKRSGTVKFAGPAPKLAGFLLPLNQWGQLGGPKLPPIETYGQPVILNEYAGYSINPDPLFPSVDLKFDSEANDFKKRSNDSVVQITSEITLNYTAPFVVAGTISAQYSASQTEFVWVSRTRPDPDKPKFSGVNGKLNPWDELISVTFQPDGNSPIPTDSQMADLLKLIGVRIKIEGYAIREVDTGKRWECSCTSTRILNV